MPSLKTETSAAELACALEAFLAEHPRAAVLEDGRVLFEMQTARYALSAEHGRCVLHLWSEERNLVRTVTGIDARKKYAAHRDAALWPEQAANAATGTGSRHPHADDARSAARRNICAC